ncbi:MAG TPA: fibrobacter succinogenes major paralogous domain-containing protein [Saprospiraceae bacterium]|nr:fibrobacter succinogenes major paralogous domain-containing protein [Saprospiraceae bacterium]
MKTSILFLAFILTVNISAQVGIGTTNPTSSAQLDIASTTSGLLPPRMTQDQRNAITNPVAGLMIWCNNCVAPAGELQVFNGLSWTNMMGGTTPSGTVTICSEICAVKNLDVDRYRNGDPIPKVSDGSWGGLLTGAYCYYNNDSATYAATYGKLYNWYAVNDPRGLAPAGWHVPSDDEWFDTEICLGGTSVAGGAMKETGFAHWQTPNTGATNSSGYTGLPGGIRSQTGTFSGALAQGFWWSSTSTSSSSAIYRDLSYSNDDLHSGFINKHNGYSVRCFRD